MSFKSTLTALCIATAALVGPATAEGFKKGEVVSSDELTKKPYVFSLKDGTKLKLIKAVNDKDPKATCYVHKPSLPRTIEGMMRGGFLEPTILGAQQVSLQVKQDPNTGSLWCGGAGSGCTIVISD